MEVIQVLQTAGSFASLVLFPIWKELKELRKSQEEINVTMAKEYVPRNECMGKHGELGADIRRVHERIDDCDRGRK